MQEVQDILPLCLLKDASPILAGTDKVIRILTVTVAHRSVHRKKPNDILARRTEQNGIVVGILHIAFTFLVI